MSPSPCDRCQRFTKTSLHTSGGASEQLCKDCGKNVELESLPSAPVCPDVALFGRVVSTRGSVQDACVGVCELGEWTRTDARGKFNLRGVVSQWLQLALEELFDLLHSKDPASPEAWLRKWLADACLSHTYEPLLRCSGIGAALDRNTFISMAAEPGAIAGLAPWIFASAKRSRIVVLSCAKDGLAPTSLAVDVVEQLRSPSAALRVAMPAVAASGVVDPAAGGQVVDAASGASVGLLPGTLLLQAGGSLYQGAVTVSLAVIDASDPASLEAMPGDFSGLAADGSAAQIQSFGALWVGLSGDGGAQLQLAEASPGMELNLLSDTPVNFEMLGVPPTIWEFDASTGKWKEDAVGSLAVDGVPLPQAGTDPFSVGPPAKDPAPAVAKKKAKGKAKAGVKDEFHSSNHYDFLEGSPVWTPQAYANLFGAPKRRRTYSLTNIKRSGYWNCDAIYITAFARGRLVDEDGEAITKANVWCVGKNYAGASPRSGVDERGQFTILAQCLSDIEVHAILPSSSPAGGEEAFFRFKLGTFTTGPPGKTQDLDDLVLSRSKRSSTPPPSRVQGQE